LEIKEGSKEFKILYLSNAPFAPSGYGVQCSGNCYAWNKHYDVRVLSNYGLQGRRLALNGLQIYPNLPGDPHGDKTAQLIFKKWRANIFITLYDIWMGAYVREHPQTKQLVPLHPHWMPIIMVDHEPIPEATLIAAKPAYKIVTPTRYGVEQFKSKGVEAEYIPFGIDTKVFRPSKDKKADKNWLGKHAASFNLNDKTEIDENSFLICINGANKDPYRKAFMRMFIAFQIFLQDNPDAKSDARIYVHSWMKQARDIPHGAKTLNIDRYCRGSDDYDMMTGIPDSSMVRMYGAGDIFMHLSQGGGFEIPILEAMTCGVPVIASDFIGMSDLVRGNGWLVPAKAKYFTPLDALQVIVDEFKAADMIGEAYNSERKRKEFGEAGRKFSLQFDWKNVNPQWYKLFEQIRDEWRGKPLNMRRL